LNQTAADRIERNGKDDRNVRYCLPEDGNGGAIRDDDVNLAPLEFSGNFTDAIGSSRGPAILDRCSISLDPAEFPQMRDESGRPRTPYGRIRAQYSDEPLIPWVLAANGHAPTRPQTILMNSRRSMASLHSEDHFPAFKTISDCGFDAMPLVTSPPMSEMRQMRTKSNVRASSISGRTFSNAARCRKKP
jgi:hypothetical protein